MSRIHHHEEEHIDLSEPAKPSVSAVHVHPVETRQEYWKFAGVIVAILIVGLLITSMRGWAGNRVANDFMAVFFIVFATFKFVNLEMFVEIYRTYDILSQKFGPWAYMFPFVELGLGLSYFISSDAWMLNLATMLVMGAGGYSVYKALVTNKDKIHCACLGSVIKLPLTKVSFVENATMFVMAAIMLAA